MLTIHNFNSPAKNDGAVTGPPAFQVVVLKINDVNENKHRQVFGGCVVHL